MSLVLFFWLQWFFLEKGCRTNFQRWQHRYHGHNSHYSQITCMSCTSILVESGWYFFLILLFSYFVCQHIMLDPHSFLLGRCPYTYWWVFHMVLQLLCKNFLYLLLVKPAPAVRPHHHPWNIGECWMQGWWNSQWGKKNFQPLFSLFVSRILLVFSSCFHFNNIFKSIQLEGWIIGMS